MITGMPEERKTRLAVIDMNNGEPNQGLRCIKEIVATFDESVNWQVFDARVKNEIPDLSFDIFISSGGPGSPKEGGGWKERFSQLIQDVWEYNKVNETKKYFFFICHITRIVYRIEIFNYLFFFFCQLTPACEN